MNDGVRDFATDVSIDRTRLEDELEIQARIFWYWGVAAEEAKYRADRLKAKLEHIYSGLDATVRAEFTAAKLQNTKWKYTEAMVTGEIKRRKEYIEVQEEYQKAARRAGQLQVAARAIAHKRDMLMQLGANSRVGVQPTNVKEKAEQVREMLRENRINSEAQ